MMIPTSGPSDSSCSQMSLTSGAGTGCSGMHVLRLPGGAPDVAAVMGSGDPDQVDAGIRAPARGLEVGTDGGYVENAPAGRLEAGGTGSRPGMEDRDTLELLGRVDAGDRVAALRRVGIPARGDDDA